MEKTVTFRLDDDLMKRIDEASAKRNITRSAFIKMAVTDYLDSMVILEDKWPKMQAELAELQKKMSEIPLPFDAFCIEKDGSAGAQ